MTFRCVADERFSDEIARSYTLLFVPSHEQREVLESTNVSLDLSQEVGNRSAVSRRLDMERLYLACTTIFFGRDNCNAEIICDMFSVRAQAGIDRVG